MKLTNFYKYKLILNSSKVIEQKEPGENTGFKFNSSNPDFYKVKYFQLIPLEGEKLSSLLIEIPPKARLIWFTRTIVHQGLAAFKLHVYMIGWQTTVKRLGQRDVNIKHILYFYPDGTIENSSGEPTLLNLKIEAIEEKILNKT